MAPSKKRNKNGTWSPIYGQAWSHPKTERACKAVQDAGHKPRYAPFLVLGWLHRLNIWCLANSTSGVVTALSDAKLAAVAWPEAFDDGIPPSRAGGLVRSALRGGGFLEDSPEGERVHEFRAFHARILSDRERHVGDDDSDDTKTPPEGDHSAEGSAERSAESSAEGSAEDSVEGSAAIGSDRIGSERIGRTEPPTPAKPGAPGARRPKAPPSPAEAASRALAVALGSSLDPCRKSVRALLAAGWDLERIHRAIAEHAQPGDAPWDWAKAARGAGPAAKPASGAAAVAAWAQNRRDPA